MTPFTSHHPLPPKRLFIIIVRLRVKHSSIVDFIKYDTKGVWRLGSY
jgi:hypothetical protein